MRRFLSLKNKSRKYTYKFIVNRNCGFNFLNFPLMLIYLSPRLFDGMDSFLDGLILIVCYKIMYEKINL